MLASAKGLNQHQRQKQACFTKMKQKYNVDRGYVTAQETIETLPVYPINRQPNNHNISSFVSEINRNFRLRFPQATDHIQPASCFTKRFTRENMPKVVKATNFG